MYTGGSSELGGGETQPLNEEETEANTTSVLVVGESILNLSDPL